MLLAVGQALGLALALRTALSLAALSLACSFVRDFILICATKRCTRQRRDRRCFPLQMLSLNFNLIQYENTTTTTATTTFESITMFRADRTAIIKAGKMFRCLCALIPIIGIMMPIFVSAASQLQNQQKNVFIYALLMLMDQRSNSDSRLALAMLNWLTGNKRNVIYSQFIISFCH